MYAGITQKLTHKKTVVQLNLLRLVRNILDAREADYFSSPRETRLESLMNGIRTLAEKDSAVLVRNLASELVRSHIVSSPDNGIPSLSSTASTGSSRSRSSSRRIYTPPSLQHSASTPMTPTSASSSRPSLLAATSASAAFIEVASSQSPRRSSAAIARAQVHERRDSVGGAGGGLPYRPQSKDGALYRRGSRDDAASSSGIPVSSSSGALRRSSTDIHAQQQQQAQKQQTSNGGNGGRGSSGKLRLSRGSRPHLGGLAIRSSESLLSSNKENFGATAGGSPSSSALTPERRPSVQSLHSASSSQGQLGSPVQDLGGISSGSNGADFRRSAGASKQQQQQQQLQQLQAQHTPQRERRRSRVPSSDAGLGFGGGGGGGGSRK